MLSTRSHLLKIDNITSSSPLKPDENQFLRLHTLSEKEFFCRPEERERSRDLLAKSFHLEWRTQIVHPRENRLPEF